MNDLNLIIGFGTSIIFTIIFLLKWRSDQKRIRSLTSERDQLTHSLNQSQIDQAKLEGQILPLQESIKKLEFELTKKQTDQNELLQENAKLFANNLTLQKEQQELINIETRLKKEFENISHKIIEQNASSFNESSSTNIKNVLEPFKQKLEHFEKGLNDKYLNEVKDKTALKTEISKLIELNTKLSDDAVNLTKALTGDNKLQGNWGEIILQNVLEKSGLEKDTEFVTQKSLQQNGTKFIPDAIIYLPDNKHIIVDAKVSLKAYNEMINSENPDHQKTALRNHLISLKSHIKELSSKGYYELESLNSPEFTLLFLPIESSFSITLKKDTELFNYAWERNIIIVSPTTLLATLRTIASIWKHEKQTQHVMEIAKEGGALHDKFVAFMDDFEKIAYNIQQSQKSYDNAFNKLSSGKGNIIKRTNNLKNLGAKAKKALSSELIEKAENSILQSPSNE